jgi:hypothetical protein
MKTKTQTGLMGLTGKKYPGEGSKVEGDSIAVGAQSARGVLLCGFFPNPVNPVNPVKEVLS